MVLYIILLGFFVSFLLLINSRKSHPANIFLFFFLLINNLYLLVQYAVVFSKNAFLIAIVFVHLTPLYYLLGPCLFFYVRGIVQDKVDLKKIDLLHLIPAFLFLINIIPYVILPWKEKIAMANNLINEPINFLHVKYLFSSPKYSFGLRPVFSLLYVVFGFYNVFKSKLFKQRNNFQERFIKNWLMLLLTIVFVLYASYLFFSLITLNSKSYSILSQNAWYFLLVMFLGVLAINTILFFFPFILYGSPQLQMYSVNDESKKTSNSFEVSNDKIQVLDEKITQYLMAKPYLQRDFSLSKMSNDLKVPSHHLTYYFNEYLGKSYNSWKNDLRIEFVLELFTKGDKKEFTLEALSKEVGFNSRSNFIDSFKSKTGMTPTEWLKSNKS